MALWAAMGCWLSSDLAAQQTPASDWPCFQGPRGDATSPEVGLLKTWGEAGPELAWKVELGIGYGGAAVRDGRVFLFDRIEREADVLRVFDLDTGEELWSWRYDAPESFPYAGSRTVPAVEAGHVYTAGAAGHVHCVDRETRRSVWSVHLVDDFGGITPGFGYVQSPLVVDDLLIVAPQADDAGLVALDRFSGEEVWRTGGLGTSHTTPTLMTLGHTPQVVFLSAKGVPLGGRSMSMGRRSGGGGDRGRSRGGEPARDPERRRSSRSGRGSGGVASSQFPDGVGSVASFDLRDGKPLWSTDLYFCWQPVCAPLQVDATRVFLTGGYRSGSLMIDVERDAGGAFVVRELFRNPRGSHVHLPILHDDYLYLVVNENFNTQSRARYAQGGLLCLDLQGNEVWRTGAEPFFGRGNVLAADGVLYTQDGHSGVLRVVEPTATGYVQLAEANVFESPNLRRDQKMWAPMALSAGRLLMRSQRELRCFDLRPGPGGR